MKYSGGAILHQSKAQSVTAMSLTEAELNVAVLTAAKNIKYIGSVLFELRIPCNQPTPIYKESNSAIKITNANKPTCRTKHIGVGFFVIHKLVKKTGTSLVCIASQGSKT